MTSSHCLWTWRWCDVFNIALPHANFPSLVPFHYANKQGKQAGATTHTQKKYGKWHVSSKKREETCFYCWSFLAKQFGWWGSSPKRRIDIFFFFAKWRWWKAYPTNNALLLSSDAEIMSISTDWAYKSAQNVQKLVCNVCVHMYIMYSNCASILHATVGGWVRHFSAFMFLSEMKIKNN